MSWLHMLDSSSRKVAGALPESDLFLDSDHETSAAGQKHFLVHWKCLRRAFRLQSLCPKGNADSAIFDSVVSVKFDPPV